MSRWSHPVASFWAGEDLSFVEQMVIRSYLEQGCDFTLYLGHPVGGIPQGTPVRDAAEIMPRPDFAGDAPGRKQLAVWSDLFRIRLLRQRPVIWADLDAYCLRPYDFPGGYVFGRNNDKGILSGVLALPQASPALNWMADFIAQEQLELPWAEPAWIARRARAGTLGPADLAASIILPQGRNGPAFIAYPNFRVYFEWNQSFVYVTTAAYFATRLEGAPVYDAGHPDPGLSDDQMKQLQRLLAARGHDVGDVDGILGARTRAAVQTEQARLGLPADAWPTADLLSRL